nr:protein transport protein SEC31 homolog B [Tanacetum cinerariifolium]
MEKTMVLDLASNGEDCASLCKRVEKYDEILASQGLLTMAMEYLKLMGTKDLSTELIILRDRIALSSELEYGNKIGSVWENLLTWLCFISDVSNGKRIRLKRDKSEQKQTKPDKNRKRVEAGKSLKQLQWVEQEKLSKMQKEWAKMQMPVKSYSRYKKRKKKGAKFANSRKFNSKDQYCQLPQRCDARDGSCKEFDNP